MLSLLLMLAASNIGGTMQNVGDRESAPSARPSPLALCPDRVSPASVAAEAQTLIGAKQVLDPARQAEEDLLVSTIFAQVIERGGKVTPLYCALARSPEMLRAWKEFSWHLRDDATASRAIRELMILRILQLARARNEFDVHKVLGRKAGLSTLQIEDLARWPRSSRYSKAERAAIKVAEEISAGPTSKAGMSELNRYFSQREVIELVMTSSFYVMVLRFTQSLKI